MSNEPDPYHEARIMREYAPPSPLDNARDDGLETPKLHYTLGPISPELRDALEANPGPVFFNAGIADLNLFMRAAETLNITDSLAHGATAMCDRYSPQYVHQLVGYLDHYTAELRQTRGLWRAAGIGLETIANVLRRSLGARNAGPDLTQEAVERVRRIVFYEYNSRDTLIYNCALGHITGGDLQDIVTALATERARVAELIAERDYAVGVADKDHARAEAAEAKLVAFKDTSSVVQRFDGIEDLQALLSASGSERDLQAREMIIDLSECLWRYEVIADHFEADAVMLKARAEAAEAKLAMLPSRERLAQIIQGESGHSEQWALRRADEVHAAIRAIKGNHNDQ